MKEVIKHSVAYIRILSAAVVEKAKSGHPGGAMGGADFIPIVYAEFFKYNPTDRKMIDLDRYFPDPVYMSPVVYSILAMVGMLSGYASHDHNNYKQWGITTSGNPKIVRSKGAIAAPGATGMGHIIEAGAAITGRFLLARFGERWVHNTSAFISVGGIYDLISPGAGQLAGYLGLKNLTFPYRWFGRSNSLCRCRFRYFFHKNPDFYIYQFYHSNM
jgi:transketolase